MIVCPYLFIELVRYFVLLENVSSLLTLKLRPLLMYLMEACCLAVVQC